MFGVLSVVPRTGTRISIPTAKPCRCQVQARTTPRKSSDRLEHTQGANRPAANLAPRLLVASLSMMTATSAEPIG